MIINSALSKAFFLALLSGVVRAQVDYDEIKTPQNQEWLHNIDLSSVPNTPIRAVGSGICPESACDGADNDRCFESCGNAPSPEDIYGCIQDHQWALTFDDGPSNYTSELLDILDKENVKATFCVMGSHVEQYPDILKRAYEAGHQIASHTYSHPHLMSLTNEEIIYEVKATEEAIEKAIGIKPHYIRPPFGEADERVKRLLQTMGYKVLLWNVDPTDYDVYMHRNASKVIQGTFKMAVQGNDTGLNLHEDPGFISLQHGK
jgi:peptidoglycan/xylan/chitin deacetylase (PgdA/CDA1 family)